MPLPQKKEAKLAAWYHARYRRKVDDAVAAELKVALFPALQEMNARREIAERETRARLDAEFCTRVLEGVSESHNIARIPLNEGVIIVSRLIQPDDAWSMILAVKPSKLPQSFLSGFINCYSPKHNITFQFDKKIKLQKMALTGDSAGPPLGMDDEDSTLVGMYHNDDDEEEVGLASSAAGRTPGVGPPNTSIWLALRINDDRFEN
jgi:hypothetical protein